MNIRRTNFSRFCLLGAGSKRSVRNGVRKCSAHVRAQGLKSERTRAQVNAQICEWGIRVNTQVREQSARVNVLLRTFKVIFCKIYDLENEHVLLCNW